jgi:tol-pal system protein YbgF
MKNLTAAAVLLLGVACASSDPPEPTLVPAPTAAADPRLGEVQTQLTELLERIDVLNDRIARLEESREGSAPASAVVPRSVAATREEPAADAPPAPQVLSPPQPALVGAQIAGDYRNAIVLYGQGKLADARRAFQAVFDVDPHGDLADNALFWIGETYFAAKDYANALRLYSRVSTEYSDQNKAPDALFKTALAQERTGDLTLARKTLQQVIDRYPYSSSASTAKQELQRLRY